MTQRELPPSRDEGLVIDCSGCPRRGETECEDCIVSFLIDRSGEAIVFDAAEERALRSLRDGGLLPGVRLHLKTG